MTNEPTTLDLIRAALAANAQATRQPQPVAPKPAPARKVAPVQPRRSKGESRNASLARGESDGVIPTSCSPSKLPPPLPPGVYPDTGQPLQGAARVGRSTRWQALGGRQRAIAKGIPGEPGRTIPQLRAALRAYAVRTGRSGKRAAPLLSIACLLEGAAVPLGRRGATVDAGAAAKARWPVAYWRLWAKAGWLTTWASRQVKSGTRWMAGACGAMVRLTSLGRWRKAWAREPWGGWKLETAQEWAIRTGANIPDWLRQY